MDTLKRLNKYVSETGYCSRREADDLIANGRITVNGEQPEMGLKVSDEDTILIDGKPLKSKPKAVFIAYNKPVGITCTTERKIKSNIVRAINYPERIFPIGRLDRPSEGLIFLTNQGDLVNKILRAGNNHEKEYVVSVDKPIDNQFIQRMGSGIPILGTVTKRCKVIKQGPKTFKITLTQGLNRQIRRMCEYLGYEVNTLKRVRIMNINLNGLREGQWRHLTEKEMSLILSATESSSKTEEASSHTFKPKTDTKAGDKKRSERGERNLGRNGKNTSHHKPRHSKSEEKSSEKKKFNDGKRRPNEQNKGRISKQQKNGKSQPKGRVKGTLSLKK